MFVICYNAQWVARVGGGGVSNFTNTKLKIHTEVGKYQQVCELSNIHAFC